MAHATSSVDTTNPPRPSRLLWGATGECLLRGSAMQDQPQSVDAEKGKAATRTSAAGCNVTSFCMKGLRGGSVGDCAKKRSGGAAAAKLQCCKKTRLKSSSRGLPAAWRSSAEAASYVRTG